MDRAIDDRAIDDQAIDDQAVDWSNGQVSLRADLDVNSACDRATVAAR
jgi:hypothetical protein